MSQPPRGVQWLGATVALVLCSIGSAFAQPASAPTDTLVIPGTGDSQDLLRELAKRYGELTQKLVEIPDSTGSSGGIESAGTGAVPLGRTAVRPSAADHEKHGGLWYREFARVPVVFVVHNALALTTLTEQQICDIYSGKLTNWKDFGGPDVAIRVQARPEGGSNMVAIREKIGCFKDLAVVTTAEPNERNSDLVASIGSKPGAIGFMPLSEAKKHNYRFVKLGALDPNARNYSLWISLGFVHKQRELTGAAKEFVGWMGTEPAQEIIRRDHISIVAQSEPPPGVTLPVVTTAVTEGESKPDETAKKEEKPEDEGKKVDIKMTGFVQVLYTYDPDDDTHVNGAFSAPRARFRLQADMLDKRIALVIQPELAALPATTLRDAFLQIKLGHHQEVRLGQLKPTFGYENPTPAQDMYIHDRSLLSRPLMSTGAYTVRDVGISLRGKIRLNDDLTIDDAVMVHNGAGENRLENNSRKDITARVGLAYKKLFRLGFSGATAQFDRQMTADSLVVREQSFRYGIDAVVEHERFAVVVEAVQAHFSKPSEFKRNGVYVMGVGKFPAQRVHLSSRFEVYEPNNSASATDDIAECVWGGITHFASAKKPDALALSLWYRHDIEPEVRDTVIMRLQTKY